MERTVSCGHPNCGVVKDRRPNGRIPDEWEIRQCRIGDDKRMLYLCPLHNGYTTDDMELLLNVVAPKQERRRDGRTKLGQQGVHQYERRGRTR